MKRTDIIGAYTLEVVRCTDITLRRIKAVKATHTGGKEAGLAELARIGGAFKAHLITLDDAKDRAIDAFVAPEFPLEIEA